MARKFLNRILPDQAKLEQSKVLRALGPWVFHPAVWTLHRRSVAGGVAAGLFCGLFPAPFQMFGAAMASFLFHWNLPVAVLTTLYTNPVTFIPLYVLALQIGIWLLNTVIPVQVQAGAATKAFPPPPDFDLTQPIGSFIALGDWALGMGWPLVAGVFTLALTLAIFGYILTRLGWNLWVRWEVIQRRKRRSTST
ncbi:MAG: DUF2062 domain-containing protein [Burkholderiaceae bacterium]|nr:DUF2062 domain-containing protein [Burkholderiaceae bacterium]